jgi:hypothetical protein
LHLSHWRGNQTPPEFKADTSTEIALRFVQSETAAAWKGRPVVNQHFDTDGTLSAWVLMNPELALPHSDLLIAAAEAGDFGEWPRNERGLWLNAALEKLGAKAQDNASAYEQAFAALPDLLSNILDRRDLWGHLEDALKAGRIAVNEGRITALHRSHLGVMIMSPGTPEPPAPLINRMLNRCWRYLIVESTPSGQYSYRYELPHYAWADTVERSKIPVPDPVVLKDGLGAPWSKAHLSGLTSILGTPEPISTPPDSIIEKIEALDTELRAGTAAKFNRY